MFFFGAMNPGLNQNINLANPIAPLYSHGPYAYSTTVFNWAGKLTYKMGDSSQIEGSSFGDPSRHNQAPNSLSAANAPSVTSAYNYGSMDSVLRLNTAFSPNCYSPPRIPIITTTSLKSLHRTTTRSRTRAAWLAYRFRLP